ncbi:GDSL esterase/lipase-like protein [Drosera capensis]
MRGFSLLICVLISASQLCNLAGAQMAPAMFVFGDSLVDVGNNNYLLFSLFKVDFPHYGIDYLDQKATGRYSNGKNSADFIAEKLGLPSSPPYLALAQENSNNFFNGVNFASGGSGIYYGLNQYFDQAVSMDQQIEYYTTVHQELVQQLGQSAAQTFLSKSMFVVVIGSNDILSYFGGLGPSSNNAETPQQQVDTMISNITSQLQQIYNLGGRKFAMFGVGPVGCCPAMRVKNNTGVCHEAANYWASQYNQRLVPILEQFETKLDGFQYAYFDTYNVLLNVVENSTNYGFKESKVACCGMGVLNAQFPCSPIASYCGNRSDYVFWDLFHPTQDVARMAVEAAFDGPVEQAFPMNIRQLAAL